MAFDQTTCTCHSSRELRSSWQFGISVVKGENRRFPFCVSGVLLNPLPDRISCSCDVLSRFFPPHRYPHSLTYRSLRLFVDNPGATIT